MKRTTEHLEDERGSTILIELRQLDDLSNSKIRHSTLAKSRSAVSLRQAKALLGLLSSELPIDLDKLIAIFPTWRVIGDGDLPASAMTNWNSTSKCWFTVVNISEPIARQRFSVLHELKHIIDHPHQQSLRITLSAQNIEDACDEFAALVLMPEEFVRSAWRELPDVEPLALACHVSPGAVRVRLGALKLLPPPKRSKPSRIWVSDEYRRTIPTVAGEATMLDVSGQGQPLEDTFRTVGSSKVNQENRPIFLSSFADRMRDLSMEEASIS